MAIAGPLIDPMNDLFDSPAEFSNTDEPQDVIALADYAERAYLEYALSVVKGRALPDVCDRSEEHTSELQSH